MPMSGPCWGARVSVTLHKEQPSRPGRVLPEAGQQLPQTDAGIRPQGREAAFSCAYLELT